MKTHLRLAVIAVGLTPLLSAPSFSLLAAAAVGDNPPERTVVARDAHRRIWQRDNLITTADGKLVNQPKRVVEIATGLHYRGETGEWKESRDEIEIVADGAAATKGPHKVHLSGNIKSFGAVTITTPDNQTLRSHPLCLAFTDPITGKSAIIAELRDSDGILLPPHQVLYPDAFVGGGVRADIRVSYTKAGFESDVILRTRLPAPANWNLNEETVLLEVWHEFPEAPQPIKTWRALGTLSDEELNFGSMRIGRGAAFTLEAPLNRMSAVPVGKTWMTVGRPARTFLVESVSYKALRKELDQLPLLQAANQPLNPGLAPELLASREAGLVKLVPPHEGGSTAVRVALDMKAIDLRKGLVLDYVLLAGDTNDFRFQRDTTYFISESVNFFGDVVFEPTVVKISTAGDYMIQTWSNVVFETDDFHPVIFTSSNDRTVGEDVSVGTEMYYYGALSNTRSDLEFKNLRISYAKYGLHAYSMKVRHAQFVHCPMALLIDQNTGTEVDNTLFYDCGTAFGGFNYSAVGRHVTVNKCASLGGGNWGDPAACHLTLTNSLLVSVTNSGGITLTTNYTASNSLSTIFQTVGAGAHYLASVSSYRNAGTTNLPAWLLADLMQRTTFPPVVLASNKITTNFVMVPRVARCTDLPDLGYHYAPLDYVYGSNVLTNATLTIERGTVLGTFTPGTNSEGLTLHGNSTLVTRGDPMSPVRIVRYNMVQEQANDAWSSVYPGASIRTAATTVTPSPTARFSFTDFSQPVYDSAHFVSYPNNLGPFYFDNCTFSAGKVWSFAAACSFTNCLFLRVDGYFSDDAGTQLSRFYNNSFVGGTYAFTMVATSCWSFFNNAFYTPNIYVSGDHNHGYNAYLSGGARIGAYASNDVILSGAVFHAGPLGRYYLTNSSPLTNAGSMRATNAGLYHFTTTVDQKPETNSIVDIGFHYIALASTNAAAQPLDRDGDGVPDFEEDANGNGAQDVGETSLTRQDSPFLPRDYEPLGPSSRRTPLVISEIMYAPTSGQNKFIELYNTHYLAQRLDGFVLTNLSNPNATAYLFPSNSTIAPGAFLLMTGAEGYGTAIVGLGPKNKIQLRNALGAVLLEVHYDDKAPWPVEANRTGHSLVLARPSYGENDPRAWAASEKRGGSPGYAETNGVDFLRAVKINEFLASPPTGEVDTIELYNACNRPVDISGCYLARTNNVNITLADYKIPAGTLLPPRGFARFLRNQSFTFAIDGDGSLIFDSLFLANPDRTRVIDAVKYDLQDVGISTGRTPDGSPTFSELSVRSAGGTNAAPLVRNVVINEIMYHP
ncbi:MAG TPA: lamin tail domain-containing protein, partial [Verrucomicrobiae bacterium]